MKRKNAHARPPNRKPARTSIGLQCITSVQRELRSYGTERFCFLSSVSLPRGSGSPRVRPALVTRTLFSLCAPCGVSEEIRRTFSRKFLATLVAACTIRDHALSWASRRLSGRPSARGGGGRVRGLVAGAGLWLRSGGCARG